jgi:predicted RNase H-like nuclease (RuvC/YqgF family)
MSRTKKADTEEIELLRREIKDLNSTIRHLEREIKKQGNKPDSKGAKKRQDAIIQEDWDQKNKCPQCCKGDLIKSDLGVRMITSCSIGCGYREVTRKVI